MPNLGSPSGGPKKPSDLSSLLNPNPKGPGSPTKKGSNQKTLIRQLLLGKPVTTNPPSKQPKTKGNQLFGPDLFTANQQQQDKALRNKALKGSAKSKPGGQVVSSTTTPVGTVNYSGAAQRLQNSGRGNQLKDQWTSIDPSKAGGKSSPTRSTTDPLLSRAQETIAAQMNPQLAEYQAEISAANTSSTQQQADLQDLYRRLGVQVGADQTQGDAANAAAMQSIGGNYDTLANQIAQTYGGATAGTNAELNRLGIQAVSPEATAQQGLDQNYLSNLTAIDKTNAQANSTAKSQSFDNLLTTLNAQGQLAGTMDKSKVLRAAAASIADLSSKKGALAATRRGAVDALYNQLKDARTKTQADAAQQKFMDQIAAGKLGIEQGNLGVAQGKLGLDQLNSSSQRDLRTAQALKYIHDSKRPYSTYSSSKANQPKGYTAGLSLLNQTKTGNDVAAKQALAQAKQIYQYYYTKVGSTAITELENRLKNKSAHDYLALPPDLQAAVVDALRLAGAK